MQKHKTMKPATLTLRTETLRRLSAAELEIVNGGVATQQGSACLCPASGRTE